MTYNKDYNKKEKKLGPIEVTLGGSIDLEKAIKILKNKMNKEGVLKDMRLKRYYEKPSEKKRRKSEEAARKRAAALKKMNRRFKPKYKKSKPTNTNDSNS